MRSSLSESRAAHHHQQCAPLYSLITVMLKEVKYLWRMCFLSPNLIFKLRFSNLKEMLINLCFFPSSWSFFGRSKRSLHSHLFCRKWHIGWYNLLHQGCCQEWGVEKIDKNSPLIQPREFWAHAEVATWHSDFTQFDYDTTAILDLWKIDPSETYFLYC